jgi:hypothetical protein
VLTVIVPVVTAQVGCVAVAVGVEGAPGTILITTLKAGEVHPPPLAVVNE